MFTDLYKRSTRIIKIHFLCHEQFMHIGFLSMATKVPPFIHFRLFFSCYYLTLEDPKRVAVGFLLGLELNFFQVC